MPTPLSAWLWLDLGVKTIEVNAENPKVVCVVPINGTVREVRMGQAVAHASGGGSTLIYKQAGTVTTNLLSAASVDLSALATGVAAAQTLTTANTALRVAQNDIIVAAYTITTAVTSTVGCTVAIEADYW